jgi:hypothetical protein
MKTTCRLGFCPVYAFNGITLATTGGGRWSSRVFETVSQIHRGVPERGGNMSEQHVGKGGHSLIFLSPLITNPLTFWDSSLTANPQVFYFCQFAYR